MDGAGSGNLFAGAGGGVAGGARERCYSCGGLAERMEAAHGRCCDGRRGFASWRRRATEAWLAEGGALAGMAAKTAARAGEAAAWAKTAA